jgi:hypothetical protein
MSTLEKQVVRALLLEARRTGYLEIDAVAALLAVERAVVVDVLRRYQSIVMGP